jgi:hypothetical protein
MRKIRGKGIKLVCEDRGPFSGARRKNPSGSTTKVMIVLSQASVQSRWVEREVNAAREREDRAWQVWQGAEQPDQLSTDELRELMMNGKGKWRMDNPSAVADRIVAFADRELERVGEADQAAVLQLVLDELHNSGSPDQTLLGGCVLGKQRNWHRPFRLRLGPQARSAGWKPPLLW